MVEKAKTGYFKMQNTIVHQKPKVFGAIAQLGERCPCKAEVSGSIPLSSTKEAV
jgi:hypothetical protein